MGPPSAPISASAGRRPSVAAYYHRTMHPNDPPGIATTHSRLTATPRTIRRQAWRLPRVPRISRRAIPGPGACVACASPSRLPGGGPQGRADSQLRSVRGQGGRPRSGHDEALRQRAAGADPCDVPTADGLADDLDGLGSRVNPSPVRAVARADSARATRRQQAPGRDAGRPGKARRKKHPCRRRPSWMPRRSQTCGPGSLDPRPSRGRRPRPSRWFRGRPRNAASDGVPC